MITGRTQRDKDSEQRAHTGRRADRTGTPFERGNPLFQHRHGWVRYAAVDVAALLDVKQ